MKKFEKGDLKILRGHFRAIGRSIPSSRSQTGHVSAYYVQMVLTGKIDRDNATTRAIIAKAETIVETLKN